jgi:hypothetical protein
LGVGEDGPCQAGAVASPVVEAGPSNLGPAAHIEDPRTLADLLVSPFLVSPDMSLRSMLVGFSDRVHLSDPPSKAGSPTDMSRTVRARTMIELCARMEESVVACSESVASESTIALTLGTKKGPPICVARPGTGVSEWAFAAPLRGDGFRPTCRSRGFWRRVVKGLLWKCRWAFSRARRFRRS